MKEKNHFAKVIVLVLALIVLGISMTYAYFTSQITGEPATNIGSGRLDVTTSLTEATAMNNTKVKLVDSDSDAEKVSFTVTSASTSTVDGKYDVYLQAVQLSKNLFSDDFKWKLVNGEQVLGEGTFASPERKTEAADGEEANAIVDIKDMKLNTTSISIIPGHTDHLEFRVWLQNSPTENQIELTNGSFSGKLYLEAVPVSKNQ